MFENKFAIIKNLKKKQVVAYSSGYIGLHRVIMCSKYLAKKIAEDIKLKKYTLMSWEEIKRPLKLNEAEILIINSFRYWKAL